MRGVRGTDIRDTGDTRERAGAGGDGPRLSSVDCAIHTVSHKHHVRQSSSISLLTVRNSKKPTATLAKTITENQKGNLYYTAYRRGVQSPNTGRGIGSGS